MTALKTFEPARMIIGRLTHGRDLLEELTDVCAAEKIHSGWVTAIGAVQKARIGFYAQDKREYHFKEFNHPMEIACLTGNVSLKAGIPFIHAHATFTNEPGQAFGGHLAPGTIVFACEFRLEAFSGPELSRVPDDQTGLALWKMD